MMTRPDHPTPGSPLSADDVGLLIPDPSEAWRMVENDFYALSDKEIADITRDEQANLEAAENWLEAVAAWESAGRPRKGEKK